MQSVLLAWVDRERGPDTAEIIVSPNRELGMDAVYRAERRTPHDVGSALIVLAEHVEQEEVHIVVKRLVVQEQLCQVAQILTVLLLFLAIHLRVTQHVQHYQKNWNDRQLQSAKRNQNRLPTPMPEREMPVKQIPSTSSTASEGQMEERETKEGG